MNQSRSVAASLAPVVLPDPDGNQIRLGSLWADHPAVVVFLRHYGWVFCREHVAQLRECEERFRSAGAGLAVVGLGDARHSRSFREETGIRFPLLVDRERAAYRAAGLKTGSLLHIFRRDNFRAKNRARTAGHRQHRHGQHPFQLGGSFVFGPGNVDLFSHISDTFGDNASPDRLLEAIYRRDAEVAE